MTATQWLLLDNLIHGWHFRANMTKDDALVAYAWAAENGFACDGEITEEGRGYFALHCHAKPTQGEAQ